MAWWVTTRAATHSVSSAQTAIRGTSPDDRRISRKRISAARPSAIDSYAYWSSKNTNRGLLMNTTAPVAPLRAEPVTRSRNRKRVRVSTARAAPMTVWAAAGAGSPVAWASAAVADSRPG